MRLVWMMAALPTLAVAQEEPPMEAPPVEAAPMEAAPVEAAPVEPPPVEAAPATEAPAGPEATLKATFSGSIACGQTREIFRNEKATAAQIGVTFTCDCGEGSYAALAIWGDNIDEKSACKKGPGEGGICAADVPAGAKVTVACSNDDVPQEARKAGSCGYAGKVEH